MNETSVVALILIMILGGCIALAIASGTITISDTLVSSGVYHSGGHSHGGIIPEANGSTTETLRPEAINHLQLGKNRRYKTKVELKVEQGSVRLELLDEKGQTTTSAVSTPGRPALVRGYLVTDNSGAFKYRIIATEAKNIDYWLSLES